MLELEFEGIVEGRHGLRVPASCRTDRSKARQVDTGVRSWRLAKPSSAVIANDGEAAYIATGVSGLSFSIMNALLRKYTFRWRRSVVHRSMATRAISVLARFSRSSSFTPRCHVSSPIAKRSRSQREI